MIQRTFKLIGSNNAEITLSTEDTTDYLLDRNVAGLALPPINVNITEGAGDGGRYHSSRRLPREIDLPIWVFGTKREDVETKLRTLANLISDRKGPTKIKATYTDTETETTETYTVEGYYIGGFDVNYGNNAGKDYAYIALTFKCPQPYWVSETENIITLTGTELPIAYTFTNNGDIETPPTFEIKGPIDTITLSNINGSLTYNATIGSTVTIVINTETATVVRKSDGANRYQNLAALPKMFTIPAGTSTLNITGTGIGSAATVKIITKNRREIVF